MVSSSRVNGSHTIRDKPRSARPTCRSDLCVETLVPQLITMITIKLSLPKQLDRRRWQGIVVTVPEQVAGPQTRKIAKGGVFKRNRRSLLGVVRSKINRHPSFRQTAGTLQNICRCNLARAAGRPHLRVVPTSKKTSRRRVMIIYRSQQS